MLSPDQVLDPLDRLLAEICRRGWYATVSRAGKRYESSIIRHGTDVISGGVGDTPSKAMLAAARSAIEKRDRQIEKMRNS
jgi:hypothetical protein